MSASRSFTIKQGQQITIHTSDTVDDDRCGSFVDITAPVFHLEPQDGDHRSAKYWHPLPRGPHQFQAIAEDRSGVAKVEFYLNEGQLIGVEVRIPKQVVEFKCFGRQNGRNTLVEHPSIWVNRSVAIRVDGCCDSSIDLPVTSIDPLDIQHPAADP